MGQKKPNGFLLFMWDLKDKFEEMGETFPNGLKDLNERASSIWEVLDPEEKERYHIRALRKKENMSRRNAAAMGVGNTSNNGWIRERTAHESDMTEPQEEQNPISMLQEICQKKGWTLPIYIDVTKPGTAFTYVCVLNGDKTHSGGMSRPTCKKSAKMEAARKMIELINLTERNEVQSKAVQHVSEMNVTEESTTVKHPVSELQEYCIQNALAMPIYDIKGDTVFTTVCKVNGIVTVAKSMSKKSSKRNAAMEALQQIKYKCNKKQKEIANAGSSTEQKKKDMKGIGSGVKEDAREGDIQTEQEEVLCLSQDYRPRLLSDNKPPKASIFVTVSKDGGKRHVISNHPVQNPLFSVETEEAGRESNQREEEQVRVRRLPEHMYHSHRTPVSTHQINSLMTSTPTENAQRSHPGSWIAIGYSRRSQSTPHLPSYRQQEEAGGEGSHIEKDRVPPPCYPQDFDSGITHRNNTSETRMSDIEQMMNARVIPSSTGIGRGYRRDWQVQLPSHLPSSGQQPTREKAGEEGTHIEEDLVPPPPQDFNVVRTHRNKHVTWMTDTEQVAHNSPQDFNNVRIHQNKPSASWIAETEQMKNARVIASSTGIGRGYRRDWQLQLPSHLPSSGQRPTRDKAGEAGKHIEEDRVPPPPKNKPSVTWMNIMDTEQMMNPRVIPSSTGIGRGYILRQVQLPSHLPSSGQQPTRDGTSD